MQVPRPTIQGVSDSVPVARQIFILSDLHITPAERLGNFTAGEQLVDWTRERIGQAGDDVILVLAGDIFDFLLVEQRPQGISLATAALMVEKFLDRLSDQHAWAEQWRVLLGEWASTGSRIVLLPGNHDPEWHHPDAARALNRWITGDPNNTAIETWREPMPWQARCGKWDVVVGHGNRADPVNDIDPLALREALSQGKASIAAPPGSELVVGPLAAFKRAMVGGRRRFPFLDSVKPDTRSVLLLMLYLDPQMVLKNLPDALKPLLKMIVRSLNRRLRDSQALSEHLAAGPVIDETREAAAILADEVAEDLYDSLTDSELSTAAAVEMRLTEHLDAESQWLTQTDSPLEHMAFHNGPFKALLRAWLRREARHGTSFFDSSDTGDIDRSIMAEWKAYSRGPLVVVAGHTHAARRIRMGDDQFYLNTGTWTNLFDLSPFGDDDAGLRQLIDAMASDSLTTEQRLTWAEITNDSAKIRTHT